MDVKRENVRREMQLWEWGVTCILCPAPDLIQSIFDIHHNPK